MQLQQKKKKMFIMKYIETNSMVVEILDKEFDDWGNDEQEEAYDKLQI